MDCPGEPSIITNSLEMEGRQKRKWGQERGTIERQWSERCSFVDLEDSERGHEPLEARKQKKTDTLLKPPERNTTLQTPWF